MKFLAPNTLRLLLFLAGVFHVLILVMNVFLPRLLAYRKHLNRTAPIIQQIFYVHNTYILLTVAFLGLLCFAFPGALQTPEPLPMVINGFITLFYGLRVGIQLLYYDQDLKEKYWVVNILFTTGLFYVTGLFLYLFVRQLIQIL